MARGAILTGVLVIFFGIWVFSLILNESDAPIWVFIYPIAIIGVGIAIILLRKEEDKIEQRKDLNSKKTKK